LSAGQKNNDHQYDKGNKKQVQECPSNDGHAFPETGNYPTDGFQNRSHCSPFLRMKLIGVSISSFLHVNHAVHENKLMPVADCSHPDL
jgi:hypothetical protein